MSEFVSSYLSSRLPVGGLAAYTVHQAESLLEAQCLSKSLYATSTEQMLSRVLHATRLLLPAGEHPVEYCWTYEGHRVFVAARPDGVCLSLLVENNANTQLARVREILQGFLQLTDF
jgi:hypothetical protein